jgi:hypothetical protein
MNNGRKSGLMEETRETYRFPYLYFVYGISLYSEIPLPLPDSGRGDLAHIAVRIAPSSYFEEKIRNVSLEQADGSWYQFGRLADGSSYARWQGVGEFLVSRDGLQIVCRQFEVASTESFQVYMLGQALSFALVKRGFEPIHATTVVVNGEAVVFLGDSGFGKSTLAASFISAGYPVLTDDLLILQPAGNRVLSYPGPARIKLFPKIARRFLADTAQGVRMNPDTEKLIVPLHGKQICSAPALVKAIYSLAPPREVFAKQSIRFETLSIREGFLELVKNTFNYRIIDSGRLKRQLEQTSQLVALLPVRRMSVPRDLDQLPSSRDAIIADFQAQQLEMAECVG